MAQRKAIASFHAMAELNQIAQAKISLSQLLTQKRVQQIVEHAYHQTALFYMSQNDHHSGDAISFDYVSHLLLF